MYKRQLPARVLRPYDGASAGAGLGISALAGRTLVLLVGRVFIGSIEVTVYVLTVLVADQFARIVPVSSPLAALTVCKVFPVIHSFYPFLRFTQFTFYSCGAIIFCVQIPREERNFVMETNAQKSRKHPLKVFLVVCVVIFAIWISFTAFKTSSFAKSFRGQFITCLLYTSDAADD